MSFQVVRQIRVALELPADAIIYSSGREWVGSDKEGR